MGTNELEYQEVFYEGEILPFSTILKSPENKFLRDDINKEQLYCPDCDETVRARLMFVSPSGDGKRSHLRLFPGYVHTEGCPHSYETIKHNELTDVKKVLTPSEMQIRAERVINQFMRKQSRVDVKTAQELLYEKQENQKVRYSDTNHTVRRLECRNLRWLPNADDEALDIPMLFSGIVRLRLEERTSKTGSTYTMLLLCNRTTNKAFRSIFVPSWLKLPAIDEGSLHFVVFFGCYKKHGKYRNLQFYEETSFDRVAISEDD